MDSIDNRWHRPIYTKTSKVARERTLTSGKKRIVVSEGPAWLPTRLTVKPDKPPVRMPSLVSMGQHRTIGPREGARV
jgi:hypothetical protein